MPDPSERFAKSRALYAAAQDVIPGGVTSSVRAGGRPHPIYFERGDGVYLWDVDGNRYLDFVLAWGPPFLGYTPEVVSAAVADQLTRGLTFGAQHRGELELAELMVEAVPGAEQVMFAMSGSDAVTVALRIARSYTGRPKIVKFEGHYHGWHDAIWASVGVDPDRAGPPDRPATVPMSAGMPPGALADVIVAPWNDLEATSAIFDEHAGDIAALILEPLNVNGGSIGPEPGFLEGVRALTKRHGSLLIFDEIITGFRLALGGGQEFYGVTADLAVFAKAMAGGVAISALTGSKDILDVVTSKKVIHNGTFNANPLSTAAASATLRYLISEQHEIYPRLTELGGTLAAGLQQHDRLTVRSAGPIVVSWMGESKQVTNVRDRGGLDGEAQAEFGYQLLLNGIHSKGLWYLSTVHRAEHIAKALDVVGEVLTS